MYEYKFTNFEPEIAQMFSCKGIIFSFSHLWVRMSKQTTYETYYGYNYLKAVKL